MLLSDFLYKIGWGRVFMEPLRGLLASILEKIHLSSNPEYGEGVGGGTLSNCAGGSILGTRSIWIHVLEAFKMCTLFDPEIPLVEIYH